MQWMQLKTMTKIIMQNGFTILELLISMAIISILSVSGIIYFRGSIVEVSAESTIKNFVSDINSARGRSMAGDRGMAFGVRAVTGIGSTQGSWEFFATTTNVVEGIFPTEVHYLPSGSSWKDPSVGMKELLFNPLSGSTTSTIFDMAYSETLFRISVSRDGEVVVNRIL